MIHPGWGFAGDDPAWEPARMAHYNELVRSVVAEFGDKVALVDYAAWMEAGPNGMNPDVRPDGVHASPSGARTIAEWLGPRVAAAAQG
jgi:lysophospholipase L1-like esterase